MHRFYHSNKPSQRGPHQKDNPKNIQQQREKQSPSPVEIPESAPVIPPRREPRIVNRAGIFDIPQNHARTRELIMELITPIFQLLKHMIDEPTIRLTTYLLLLAYGGKLVLNFSEEIATFLQSAEADSMGLFNASTQCINDPALNEFINQFRYF